MDGPLFKIGDAPKRREDVRFVTGRGRYLDDIAFEKLAHAVVLRSPHAHARIERIAATAARAASGVLAVLTAADAAAGGLSALRPGAETNTVTGEPFLFEPQPLLAADKVRHVGEAVALIVAETRDQAQDAAELVAVDYTPLPAVTTITVARAPSAPLVTDKCRGTSRVRGLSASLSPWRGPLTPPLPASERGARPRLRRPTSYQP